MKRNIYGILFTGVLVCGVLVGCGKSNNNETAEGSKTTITLGKEIQVEGSGATVSGDTITISKGGTYAFSGESDQVAVVVDTKQDVSIVLNGATMSNQQGSVIYGKQSKSITIETAEGTENTLIDGSSYSGDEEQKAVISSNDDLIFTGEGSLTITRNYKHCISGDDSIVFQDGTYDLTATVKDGVHCNDAITVEGGTFTISAVSDCMESEGDLTISGGTITGESQDEGLEGKNDITVNGGNISLTVTDDGLNAGNAITIEEGEIEITTTQGDAMDSNGSFIINGGKIVAYGGSAPEGALDCDNAQIAINGGTTIAVGDANSEISTDSKQASVLLGQYNKGDVIAITTEDGDEVISFTLKEARSNVIVSSEKLSQGATYKVMVNDSEDRTFTVDSSVVSAGGSANVMGGGKMGGMGQNGEMQRPDGMDGMKNQGEQTTGGMSQGNMPQGEPPEGMQAQGQSGTFGSNKNDNGI